MLSSIKPVLFEGTVATMAGAFPARGNPPLKANYSFLCSSIFDLLVHQVISAFPLGLSPYATKSAYIKISAEPFTGAAADSS